MNTSVEEGRVSLPQSDLKLNYIWLFQKQEENKQDFGVILYCLDSLCQWSLHKRVLYVEHIFHFSFGALPFFHRSKQKLVKSDFSSESNRQGNQRPTVKHSLSMLTARNIPVSDFFSHFQAKGNYLLIVNHFASLSFFATECLEAFLSLARTLFAKKVLW